MILGRFSDFPAFFHKQTPTWSHFSTILKTHTGLLSPVYAFTERGGCWFCPNAKLPELRHLYDHHPDLWARMLELQAIPGKATEKFNRTQRFSDIDAIFRQEDQESFREAA